MMHGHTYIKYNHMSLSFQGLCAGILQSDQI